MVTWKINYKDNIVAEFEFRNMRNKAFVSPIIEKIQDHVIYFTSKPRLVCYKDGFIYSYSDGMMIPHDECKILWEDEDHLVRRILTLLSK